MAPSSHNNHYHSIRKGSKCHLNRPCRQASHKCIMDNLHTDNKWVSPWHMVPLKRFMGDTSNIPNKPHKHMASNSPRACDLECLSSTRVTLHSRVDMRHITCKVCQQRWATRGTATVAMEAIRCRRHPPVLGMQLVQETTREHSRISNNWQQQASASKSQLDKHMLLRLLGSMLLGMAHLSQHISNRAHPCSNSNLHMDSSQDMVDGKFNPKVVSDKQSLSQAAD